MFGIISTLVILFIAYLVLKAIVSTEIGGLILILTPIILTAVNFTIAWENYWAGVPFPNPVSPDGFLYDIIARIIGGAIDSLLGIDFFRGVFAWILGASFYVLIFIGLNIFFAQALTNLFNPETGIIVFFAWLAFFTFFYYFHGLDNVTIFRWFSMPHSADTNIKIYYWISLVLSIGIVFKE